MRLACDIETNGLLDKVDRIWCICAMDVDTGEEYRFRPEQTKEAVELLTSADTLIFHNGVGYDMPVLKKILGFTHDTVVDTLVLSRVLHSDMYLYDESRGKRHLNKLENLWGSHSLKAWGIRLGVHKGVFAEDTDWLTFSEEMLEYCMQDVRVTAKLFHYISEQGLDERCVRIEHGFAELCQELMSKGMPFDLSTAKQLASEWKQEISQLAKELATAFPAEVEEMKVPQYYECHLPEGQYRLEGKKKLEDTLKKKYPQYTRKQIREKIVAGPNRQRIIPFNPRSGLQIVQRLTEKYNWQPTEFTEAGTPKTTGDVLSKLDYPEAKTLGRYKDLVKLYDMIEGGDGSWINSVKPDGRLYGSINSNGAVSGRCTHCVPMDTEILTRDGWKTYDMLQIGEEVLGYDLSTHTKTWTKVVDKHFFKDRIVGSFGNQSLRYRCTEEHKWITRNKTRQPEMRYKVTKAKDFLASTAVVTNAPYYNQNPAQEFRLLEKKYGHNWVAEVTRMPDNVLHSFLQGFLLADGHLKKSPSSEGASWMFAQAAGELKEAAEVALYLASETRLSSILKDPNPGKNQREGWNVTCTKCEAFRSRQGMQWEAETVEDVWCPQTELGTWVMRQNGKITITHNSRPNLAQIPAHSEDGKKCRKLFTASPGRVLVGWDASGLELRCLSHYMHRFDGGEYGRECSTGDIHTKNQEAAGLPTRDNAKTFIYGFVYGAGDEKVGQIVKGTRMDGARLKKAFLRAIPAIGQLQTSIASTVKANGKLKGLDGRPLPIRKKHAAMNTLLQSAGAVLMKLAGLIQLDLLKAQGIIHGVHYDIIATVHDEYVIDCDLEHADAVLQAGVESLKLAGDRLGFRCPLDAEGQTGGSWYDIH